MFFFIIDGATAMFLGGLGLAYYFIKFCFKVLIFFFTFLPKICYYTMKYSILMCYWLIKIFAMLFGFSIELADTLGLGKYIKKLATTIERKLLKLKDIKIENIKDFTQYKYTKHILLATTLITPIIFFVSAVNDCMAIGISSALVFMTSLILLITYKCKNKRL